MNKTQFYLHFETMPKGTAQQKGVYVRNGRPHFYRKDNVNSARHKFIIALRPNKPKIPIDKPVKLYLWFAYDVKDKKKWGKYKPTVTGRRKGDLEYGIQGKGYHQCKAYEPLGEVRRKADSIYLQD